MPNLTIDVVKKLMRDIEAEQDAADLDMFLSDNWPAYRLLREGGSIVECDGKYYVIAKPDLGSLWPIPRSFDWKR